MKRNHSGEETKNPFGYIHLNRNLMYTLQKDYIQKIRIRMVYYEVFVKIREFLKN